MKNLRQLREETAQTSSTQANKLDVLVRSGLFEENKLTLLRRALDESNTKLSNHERKALQELSEKLITALAEGTLIGGNYEEIICETDEQLNEAAATYSKVSDFTKMPPIIVLKRRMIRVFGPGNQVAMYWSDALNRYIAIPFDQPPIVTEEITNKTTIQGYYNALLHSLHTDPHAIDAARAKIEQQKDRIIKMYGQEKFDALHAKVVQQVQADVENRKKQKAVSDEQERIKKVKAAPLKLSKPNPRYAKALNYVQQVHSNPLENFQRARADTGSLPIAAGAALGGMIFSAIHKPILNDKLERAEARKVKGKAKWVAYMNKPKTPEKTIPENFRSNLKLIREKYSPLEAGLDAVSLVPWLSPFASGANALLNATEGDWGDAALDAFGMVPVFGKGATAAKIAAKTAKAAKELELANDARKAIKGEKELEFADDAAKINKSQKTAAELKAERDAQRRAELNQGMRNRNRSSLSDKLDVLDMTIPASNAGIPAGDTGNYGQSSPNSVTAAPVTGFNSVVKGLDPFTSRPKTNLTAIARMNAQRVQNLHELRAVPRLWKFIRRAAGIASTAAMAAGLSSNSGSGSGTPSFIYNKQRPATGFRAPVEAQDSMSRAIRDNVYGYGAGAAYMGRLNRNFMSGGNVQRESTEIIDKLKVIAEGADSAQDINIGNDSILVSKSMATNVLKLYESINDENKAKLNRMLNESTDKFYKVLDFAVRH